MPDTPKASFGSKGLLSESHAKLRKFHAHGSAEALSHQLCDEGSSPTVGSEPGVLLLPVLVAVFQVLEKQWRLFFDMAVDGMVMEMAILGLLAAGEEEATLWQNICVLKFNHFLLLLLLIASLAMLMPLFPLHSVASLDK